MKKAVFAAVAVLVGALSIAVAGASADNVRFGVNDDEGMFEKGSGPFLPTLTGLGMHDNTVTVRWDETSPTGFEDLGGGVTLQSFLPSYVAAANLAGVTLTFDVYPRHSQAAGDPATNAPKFAAWLKGLAQAYPSVTHYVVMNECNQPLFVNPQYDGSGNLVSAAACGQFLAQGYQALKSVNPGIFVWGLGLSPHGAKVDGKSHRDSDPFSFLAALGQWYKTSPYAGGKIMDGLDLHPYPIPQSVPFAQGNSNAYGPAYGVATLPLVYQAFYGAFGGTAQPTVGPGRLPVSLNEVGVQTVPSVGGYTGSETPGWSVDANTGSEPYQAQWYKQLVDATQCDADITNVNIFKLVDQPDLGAWQSGLYQLGWVAKQSAAVVQQEIASVTSCPTGAAAYWSPAGVTGPTTGGSTGSTGSSGAAVGGSLGTAFANAVPGQMLTLLSGLSTGTLVSIGTSISAALGPAATDLTGTESLLAAGVTTNGRRLASAALPSKTFAVAKGKKVKFPSFGKVAAGTYRLKITLKPKKGGAAVTLTSAPFGLTAAGKVVKAGTPVATTPASKPNGKPKKK